MTAQEIREMSTRNCKYCGELRLEHFTPEVRATCRACYNKERRTKNALGSEKLKLGTWIDSSVLSELHQLLGDYGFQFFGLTEAQVNQQLQMMLTALKSQRTTERSQLAQLEQKLVEEIAAKDQSITKNLQIQAELEELRSRVHTGSAERSVIDQLEQQLKEEKIDRDKSIIENIQLQQKVEDLNAQISRFSIERSVSDQQNLVSEIRKIQERRDNREILRLEDIIREKEARLSERSVVDQSESKLGEEIRARDIQMKELLETLKRQNDQITIFLAERPRIAQLEQRAELLRKEVGDQKVEFQSAYQAIRNLQAELIPVVSSKRSADPIPTIYPPDPRADKTDIDGAWTTPTSSGSGVDPESSPLPNRYIMSPSQGYGAFVAERRLIYEPSTPASPPDPPHRSTSSKPPSIKLRSSASKK